jgi:hypothetical protein
MSPLSVRKASSAVTRMGVYVVNVDPLAINQIEANLNKLGSEGWELGATIVPFRRADEDYVVSFIFKRPRR